MKTVGGFRTTDPLPTEGLASWYVPGLMDGFGDRLLMFDNTDSDALEMLRFRAALVDTPGFEEVLHERVRRLSRLSHAAFPVIRAVERLESDGSLVLVSTYTPGRRLSALLAEPRLGKGLHPAFVTWVVGQVIHPLSILQSEGDDFAHSALTADRIILTTDGRVRVVEHVLGSALRHLNCSAARLWRDFGLLVPNDHPGIARLDARVDVFQLGVLALSMLLARRVTPLDVEQRLPSLLDQWNSTAATRSHLFGDRLRLWLERALQVGDRPYCSAAEACADLRRLPSASASRTFEFLQTGDVDGLATPLVKLQSAAQARGQKEALMANRFSLDRVELSDSTPLAAQPLVPDNGTADFEETQPVESNAGGSRSLTFAGTEAAREPKLPNAARMAAVAFRSRGARLSVAVGLAVVAVVEAVVIATMFVQEPPTSAAGAAAASASASEVSIQLRAPQVPAVPIVEAGLSTPTAPAVSDQSGSVPPDSLDVERQKAAALAAAIAQAARNQRSGGVRLAAPIELNVLQGDRVLGSSADGPIVTTAGTHELDLINTSLGFRARRAVTFRAGEITTVTIAIPPGRISVNAEPWADVWIDNRPVGETPLANLEVPIGEHEVVFRHPDLGERRQNVIVRADAVARASTTFDR